MKRPLATLALATIPIALLTACNGGGTGNSGMTPSVTGAAAASHHGKIRHNDNGPQDLHTGGSDTAGYAYNLGSQPVGYYNQQQAGPGAGSLFYSAPTTGTIYYCITGSTAGRNAFEGANDSKYPPTGPCAALGQSATGFGGRQDPLDFTSTAIAMASTECCGSSTPYAQHRLQGTQTWGQPFEFPQLGAVIVLPFNPQNFSVSTIKLSTWTYCAISNGTVSDWNDPAITQDNGKSVTGGTSEPITFFFRADGGATTFNYQNHLNTVCNVNWKAPYNQSPYQGSARSAAWTFAVNTTWNGPGSSGDPNPNFIGEQGDPGIVSAVQSTGFSTGYVTGAYVKAATSPALAQAWLQNGYKKGKGPYFIDPAKRANLTKSFAKITAKNIQFGEGNDGNTLGSSTPWCQLFIPTSAYVNPPTKSYPIVGVNYLLFYGQNNGVHVSDKIALIKFLESKSAVAIINTLEYVPLSQSIQGAVLTALNGSGSQAACVQ
jgi:ABC-type phosphate transport system substrate-binding protein